MSCTCSPQSLDGLVSSWGALRHLKWDSPFVLPRWLKVWWQELGSGADEYVREVTEDGNVIGIAALQINEGIASFIGGADVTDYLDFVVAPGKEQAFFSAVLDDLNRQGVREFHLESLRHDSTAMTSLVDLARGRGYGVSCTLEDVSLELDLPGTWDEYLEMLAPKQRGEVKRKLRRLNEAGDVQYRAAEGGGSLQAVMDLFLDQLRQSREDKAAFMTERMECFFRAIAVTMAEDNLLRFGILELDARPVAVVMCFDYNESVYLYNSGYDTRYSSLSVGLLSKVLSIKDSIERGKKRYDFLKGAEEYKYRLGGREIPIYGCRMCLK